MFSDLAIDHIQNRRNRGKLESATSVGIEGAPGDGPYCIVYLATKGGVITNASYETYGCPTSIASAGILVQLVIGRSCAQASILTAEDLAALLGSIPVGKEDCPARAVEALKKALDQEHNHNMLS